MRFDTRYKLARAERLGDVIVAANLETEDTVHLVDPRRQKQNRQAREAPAGSYAAAKLKAVQTGQHHIEHNQIGRVPFDRCEGAIAAAKDAGLESRAREVVFDQPG